MEQPIDSDGDEWEYEYHETEIESFYLNVDLSSIHGPSAHHANANKNTPPPPNAEEDEDSTPTHPPDTTLEVTTTSEPFTPLDSTEPEALAHERIQILGLHTCNPIISYCNQIFSCTWADQIGTELIFAHPDNNTSNADQPLSAPLLQGPSFELLAANSVKILGRKANITSSASAGLVAETQAGTSTNVATLTSAEEGQAPATTPAIPRRAVQPSHQANFLARLQSIKAARGETDTVRTTYSTRRNVNIADRLGAWARTEAQLAEIHSLNDRAHKGDVNAMAALEQLMRDFAQQQQARQQQEQQPEEQQQEAESSSFPIDPQLI